MNQSSLTLSRASASPPCTLNFLFPKPLYRKLSQHRKDPLRGLSHWHYQESSSKKTHSVTDRTQSPHSFLSIGRQEDRTGLTLLFQQRAIVSGSSERRLRQCAALAERGKQLQTAIKRQIDTESLKKRRALRQRSLYAFGVLTRTDQRAGRRLKTLLPALNRPATPGEPLGPW